MHGCLRSKSLQSSLNNWLLHSRLFKSLHSWRWIFWSHAFHMLWFGMLIMLWISKSMPKHNVRVSSDQTGCIGDLVSGLPSVGSHPAAAACSLAEESAWLVCNIRCMYVCMYVCMYGENGIATNNYLLEWNRIWIRWLMDTCSWTVLVSVFIKEKFSSRQFRNLLCNIIISINSSIYKLVASLVEAIITEFYSWPSLCCSSFVKRGQTTVYQIGSQPLVTKQRQCVRENRW